MGYRVSGLPNFRLTPASGDELTSDQELIVQAIEGGTYFHYNETPSGSINDSNKIFTLSSTPNPSNSVLLLMGNVPQIQGIDYTISGLTITMTEAPMTGSVIRANYVVDPT